MGTVSVTDVLNYLGGGATTLQVTKVLSAPLLTSDSFQLVNMVTNTSSSWSYPQQIVPLIGISSSGVPVSSGVLKSTTVISSNNGSVSLAFPSGCIVYKGYYQNNENILDITGPLMVDNQPLSVMRVHGWPREITFYDINGNIITGDTISYDESAANIPFQPVDISLSITRANVTKNGAPVASGALTLNSGDALSVTGQQSSYDIAVQTNGATVEFNGTPVGSGSTVVVNANSTLSAERIPPTITPTIGNDMTLKLNGNAITDNVPVTITQTDNALTAVNTKITPTVTFTFDTGVQVQLNEVDIVSGQSYPLTENGSIIIASAVPEASTLTVNYTGLNSLTLDGTAVSDGQSVAITPGSHQLNATGATAIPTVSINGEGITQFSVNGTDLQPSNLPYTFTPTGGQTNSIYITGSDTASKTLTISGTHIGSMTVNNVEVQLPYTVTVTEPLDISVSGEIYQLDVSSKGGAIITHNNTVIANGETLHTIIDVTKDQFIEIDATHKLTVTGEDIKTITINGVAVDVSQLPVTINNNAMTASVVIGGYPPSEIHVNGLYIDSASLDGNPVAIGANGSVDLEVEVRDENHFLTIAGSQPRKYNLTFDDNGTTNISVDGQEMTNGQILPINDSKFISALPTPVPLNFDADNMSIIKVDGVPYTGDFSVDVSRETYVQVNSSSCTLTIDYGDNSYQISVPQRMVTLTAPHRDGWIFDTWTSNDIGIVNPRMVQCNIDLTGKTSAHLVANYQRYITCDKPNHWN